MLYEEKQLPELYNMKHRHDSNENYVDYESNILKNTLSSYIFNNDIINGFLNGIRKILSLMFDQHNIIKNMKNFVVDKYYFKHKN